jgi:hypothetical protein
VPCPALRCSASLACRAVLPQTTSGEQQGGEREREREEAGEEWKTGRCRFSTCAVVRTSGALTTARKMREETAARQAQDRAEQSRALSSEAKGGCNGQRERGDVGVQHSSASGCRLTGPPQGSPILRHAAVATEAHAEICAHPAHASPCRARAIHIAWEWRLTDSQHRRHVSSF